MRAKTIENSVHFSLPESILIPAVWKSVIFNIWHVLASYVMFCVVMVLRKSSNFAE